MHRSPLTRCIPRQLSLALLGLAVNLSLGDVAAATPQFATWPQLVTQESLVTIDACDVNGDGIADLIPLPHPSADPALFPLLALGGGRFRTRYLQGVSPYDEAFVHTADVNGDGSCDVVVTDWDAAPNFLVYVNDGEGSFRRAFEATLPATPFDFRFADFDGDGDDDIAVLAYQGQQRGSLLLRNDGAGRFEPWGRLIGLPGEPARITAGDFDGDGVPDVAVSEPRGAQVFVLFYSRSGEPEEQKVLTIQVDQDEPLPRALAAGDLDGDGTDELLVANEVIPAIDFSTGSAASPAKDELSVSVQRVLLEQPLADFAVGEARIFWGNSDRASTRVSIIPLDNAARELRLADLDGDGDLDIVGGGLLGLVRLRNTVIRGRRRFVPLPGRTDTDASALAVADMTGDGLPDIAVPRLDGVIDLHFGRRDGALETPMGLLADERSDNPLTRRAADLSVADVTGDGFPDILAILTDFLVVYRSDGSGSFPDRVLSPAPSPLNRAAFGDLNNDGIADAVVSSLNDPRIFVFKGFEGGEFRLAGEIETREMDFDPGVPKIADLDGDGDGDFIVTGIAISSSDSGFATFLQDAAWSFSLGQRVVVPPPPGDARLLDHDRDGLLDVLLTPGLELFRGVGDGLVEPLGRPIPSVASDIALADFDRDGWLDVVFNKAGNATASGLAGPGVFWARATGPGRFERPRELTADIPIIAGEVWVGLVLAEDFDGNGWTDVLAGADDGLAVFPGSPQGPLPMPAQRWGVPRSARGLFLPPRRRRRHQPGRATGCGPVGLARTAPQGMDPVQPHPAANRCARRCKLRRPAGRGRSGSSSEAPVAPIQRPDVPRRRREQRRRCVRSRRVRVAGLALDK